MSALRLDDVLEPGEPTATRERLAAVHELLLEAGAPPELPPARAAPAAGAEPRLLPRRRRLALLALAAALGAALFGGGYLVGDRADDVEPSTVLALAPTERAPGARGSLALFAPDRAGNRSVELRVRGLPALPPGRTYELWLLRDGAPVALGVSFTVGEDGAAVVPLTSPWRLTAAHGWIVRRAEDAEPLLRSTS